MTRFRIRSVLGVLVTVIASSAVIAAPAPGAQSPEAVFAEAAAKMANVASYHADVRSTVKAGSETFTMTGGMDFDVRHRGMNATLNLRGAGVPSMTMRMVMSHNKMYLSTDFLATAGKTPPKGLKPWVVMDLKEMAGLDLDAMMNVNPSAYAGIWEKIARQASTKTHREGSATVMSFSVSMSTLADVYRHNPKLLAAIGGESALKQLGAFKAGSVSYEIRIDGGYIVGMGMNMRMTGTNGPSAMTMTFRLSGYGKPVTIRTPDTAQTMTLEQLDKLAH